MFHLERMNLWVFLIQFNLVMLLLSVLLSVNWQFTHTHLKLNSMLLIVIALLRTTFKEYQKIDTSPLLKQIGGRINIHAMRKDSLRLEQLDKEALQNYSILRELPKLQNLWSAGQNCIPLKNFWWYFLNENGR